MPNTGHELDLTVAAVRQLTPAVKEFRLAAADGQDLPRFPAGAHLRFALPGTAGAPLERCYSLVNAACQDDSYRIAVSQVADSRGGSAYLCGQAAVGTRLRARGPVNAFPLAAGAAGHLLLAGGIGITPLLSMAHALDAAGQPFQLHYVARDPDRMAYREEVARLGARAKRYFDQGDPAAGLPLAALLGRPQAGMHVYVCGPQAMIDAVIGRCREQGWPDSQVHFELFDAPQARAGDSEIEVALNRSQRTVRVGPGQSILDALLDIGIDLPYDCRRGECGVCAVSVLEGEPEHRDYALAEKDKSAGRQMCLCVSRSRGPRLTLDL